MKITNSYAPVELDKRFYFPTLLEAECPRCKNSVTRDFMDNYLSYPEANVPLDIGIWCPTCDNAFEVKAVLRVGLEPVL